MTIASCTRRCAQAGYEIAAMEYFYQCFCDNFVSIGRTFRLLQPLTLVDKDGWQARFVRVGVQHQVCG
jgi:hypothetical protein